MLHTTRSIPLLAAVGDHQDQNNSGWVSERAQLRPQALSPKPHLHRRHLALCHAQLCFATEW